MKSLIEIVIILTLAIVSAVKLPTIFKKCKLKDRACLKEAVQDALPKLKDGLPDLGVPPLDPAKLSELTIGSSNILQLTQNYKNVVVSGASRIKLTYFNFDLDNKKIEMKFHMPKLIFNANYNVTGKILVFPVFGSGPCLIISENGTGQQTFALDVYNKGGQTYVKGVDGLLEVNVRKVFLKFDNLFNGNKLLGDSINKVLNENGLTIFNEMKGAYWKVATVTLINIMNKIFTKVPISELFLN